MFGAAVALLALLAPSAPLGAQRQSGEVFIIQGSDDVPDLDIRQVRQQRGFALFAGGDAALSGLRASGSFGMAYSNYGDCSNILRSCQSQRISATRGGTNAPWFLTEWVVGAPPSEWLKIRAVAPSVANALGRGWTAGFNGDLIGRPLRFGPADGTLGALFSGVTGTDDGSCRDHTGFSNGNFFEGGTGAQLLANSDCPETWGSNGWVGSNPIDLEGYAGWRAAAGVNFTFDFWKVPEQFRRLDKPFLASNFHTVGQSADFWQEQLAAFGSVMPGGTGTPRVTGYPLGLVVRFEAFNFAVPTVSGAKFVQAMVINRSEDIWGEGIDYDSLYFGLGYGTLMGSQWVSEYSLPDKGMVLYHNDNAQGAGGPCGETSRISGGSFGCVAGNASAARGYGNGAYGIIVLKSPIGDLRNKLFTRTPSGAPCTTADPFCDPMNPLAGDTITFNQHKAGDFGAADAATWGFSPRASFGLLSGTEDNTLDGRSVADLAPRSQYGVFRNLGYTTGVRGVHNKYVPGSADVTDGSSTWDWNKDGVADTIYAISCAKYGCVGYSSDTMPGGTEGLGAINTRGNVGGLVAVGPFALKAGDTTTFVYAHVAGGDSISAWGQFNNSIDLYLNFFLAPEAPPAARIVSTQVTPGSDQFGTQNPEVRFFFSDDPERWTDPFLMKVAADVEVADPASPYGVLRGLNPTLVADLRARAVDNLARIEIYKSCNGGNTFTADGDCDGDPATDERGGAVGFGWRAYSVLDLDATGNVANSFTDGNVDGGRTYLYTLVGLSRGANFLLNTATGPDTVVFSPSIRNVLSRSTSDPNVASVYVPASRPAGFRAATAAFTAGQNATIPFTVDLTDAATAGSYRAVFGNNLVVRRDSSLQAASPLQSLVTVERRERVSGVTDSLITAETLTFASTEVFQVAGTPGAAVVDTLVSGTDTTIAVTTRYTGLGFALVGDNGPIFGSVTLTGTATTPSGLLNQTVYPGFALSVDNSAAGTFNSGAERQLRGANTIAKLKLQASDAVVPRGLVNGFMVQWREGTSTRPNTSDGIGRYEVSWGADPFGVERGFILNLNAPTTTEAEVRASLEARPVVTTGLTDLEAAALTGVDPAQLVAVKLPFAVRNVTYDRPVDIAMARRLSNRIVLGLAPDTLSIEVPVDQWVPGDGLYFIESIVEDSTTLDGLVLSGGSPVTRTRRAMTFNRAVLGCDTPRESCNPVVQGVPGATGYDPMSDGDRTQFEYYSGLRPTGDFLFTVTGSVTGTAITSVTDSALALVRVVPNPYVVFSEYQSTFNDSRILFTNLPAVGILRIYTVAGQFVQQITWTDADLEGDGDLFWDLKTREGIDIASGLYLWVLTAPTDPNQPAGATIQKSGKFVVIRGDSR
jgi:hypothetical protein